jgi:hypothetical protein
MPDEELDLEIVPIPAEDGTVEEEVFVHIPEPAEIVDEIEILEEEEPVYEADYNNRAWLFREYTLGKRNSKDIAAQFDVDPMLVKKNLVSWDMFDRSQE